MKKIVALCLAAILWLVPSTALASVRTAIAYPYPAVNQTSQQAQAQHVIGEPRGGGYHSSARSPSSRVGGGYYSGGSTYGSHYTTPRTGFGGIGSHLFSFGTGMLLGSMFHPFGGYYGYGPAYGFHAFSIFSLIFDVILLFLVWRVVRWFLRRR